ncbi:murein biosynthesis integral membrane protein MurJ [Candidatus Bandiella numerosa]|uniref:murein biosynthesis integral membrane protein MurJ n=1 Tax=Candidatus Bandiella numerosa TaxID=2570586 RepID=UPI00249DA509|nr:murein biosynthesis integral membrane protein MurJ [Candidatus Bandiella numerosa]WHA04941.1 murein biosynthesis integral membrane protein MurJ [Candidatus Bandiella numerosa]
MSKLIRSTFVVSLCTLISRIFGYVRDIVIAAKLGTGLLNDAFIAAFRLANMFRNIFAEGALNLVFVPEFSKELKNHGRQKALEFASKVHLLLIIALAIFCLVVIVFMPQVIWYSTPGFRDNVQIYNLAVLFGRITFPYLFCISLAAFYGGILNSFNKFFPFAIAPVILNIVIIALLITLDVFETSAHSISIATLIGGVLELLWMVFFLFKYGCKLKFFKIEVNKKITKILKNIVPIIISSGITHINTWFSMIILSFFPGGLSYLYYADRIVQLPLALIGTAIGTVMLPMLTKKIKSKGDEDATNSLQNNAINLVMMFTIPATIALFFLSKNVIYTLFERGEFTNDSTIHTSETLKILIFGLPAFILIKLFQTKFYAKFNTKVPVVISITCMLINIIISITLMSQLQYLGVAIANVVSGWVNIIILVFFAHRILQFKLQKFIIPEIIKYFFASMVMISSMYIYENIVNLESKFLLLIFEMMVGFISYMSICYLFKIKIFNHFR